MYKVPTKMHTQFKFEISKTIIYNFLNYNIITGENFVKNAGYEFQFLSNFY